MICYVRGNWQRKSRYIAGIWRKRRRAALFIFMNASNEPTTPEFIVIMKNQIYYLPVSLSCVRRYVPLR
jgi:hypothetical protein